MSLIAKRVAGSKRHPIFSKLPRVQAVATGFSGGIHMSAVRTQPERTGKRAKYEDESATADKEEKTRAPIFFDTSEQDQRKV